MSHHHPKQNAYQDIMHVHHHYHEHHEYSNIPLLTCALLAALTTGGPVYAFGLYGGTLKETLSLTQSQLDTISSSNFCAGLLSWIPGMMVDKLGIKFSLSLGGLLGAIFMTAYWIVARQLVVDLSHDQIIPTLCGLGVMIFMTNGLVIGSIFKLLVSTCAPHTKGSAVGAAKGYVGLGSGVYACLFRALKTPQISDLDFLPLAAILAVLAGSLPALLLLPPKQRLDMILETTPRIHLDQTTALHLRVVYSGLIVLATIVVGTTLASLLEEETGEGGDNDNDLAANDKQGVVDHLPQQTPHYIRAILILLVWIGPIMTLLFLPTKSTKLHENSNDNENNSNNYSETETDQEAEANLHDILEWEIASDDDEEEEEAAQRQFEHQAQQAHQHQQQPSLLQQAPNECQPLVNKQKEKKKRKTASSSLALAYGAEITASVQATGPRGLLGQKALTTTMRQEVPNLTLQQMLQTAPAWLFIWITVIKVGGGTMITNNMAQMVQSLYLPHQTTTPASLALFSVAQAISRVVTGAVSDAALSWKMFSTNSDLIYWNGHLYKLQGIPRPAFLIVSCLGGLIAHVFLSLATTRNTFLVGVCFAGGAFGMIWPLMVLIIGEVFGTANMGANYMFYDGLSSALGTLLLSKYVTQEVYERHIDNKLDDDERNCYGQECFFGAHIIIAILSLTAVGASYWFYHTTRHVYAKRCA